MRKASREMPADWALEIMRKAPYITVSFTRPDGTAYGVPLSLASTSDEVWYFHCALEGDKLNAISRPSRSMSVGRHPMRAHRRAKGRLVHPAIPLGHRFRRAKLVTDEKEKIEALRAISQRFLPRHMDAFDDAIRRSLHRTAVVRITLTAPPTGKRKQYDPQGEEMKYGRME